MVSERKTHDPIVDWPVRHRLFILIRRKREMVIRVVNAFWVGPLMGFPWHTRSSA